MQIEKVRISDAHVGLGIGPNGRVRSRGLQIDNCDIGFDNSGSFDGPDTVIKQLSIRELRFSRIDLARIVNSHVEVFSEFRAPEITFALLTAYVADSLWSIDLTLALRISLKPHE